MRAVAINVGANTNEPGFRGPVWPDGGFEFIPIPEEKPTHCSVPTYGDLDPHLETTIPESLAETPVHLDPEFAGYPGAAGFTYGDDHGVKAAPLLELETGDLVLFYATLSVVEGAAWLPPDWGAFLIGVFELANSPISGETFESLPDDERELYRTNAHCKREQFDARVLLRGSVETSGRFERAVPLSTTTGGTTPGELVTEASSDSGRGPWWRRPLRFDAAGTETVLSAIDRAQPDGHPLPGSKYHS